MIAFSPSFSQAQSQLVGESVADAIHGEHITWIGRVNLQFVTEILDMRIDAAIVPLITDAVHVNFRPAWGQRVALPESGCEQPPPR